MGTPQITVQVEVSADLLEFVGPPEVIASRLRQALVIEMFFNGEISQGKTSELLGITVWDMLDLIAEYRSRQPGVTAEEILEDVTRLEAMRIEQASRASD